MPMVPISTGFVTDFASEVYKILDHTTLDGRANARPRRGRGFAITGRKNVSIGGLRISRR